MIGLDTNVLVRLIVKDDTAQFRRFQHWIAAQATSSGPFYVNTVVLCESIWVLQSEYGYAKADIIIFIDGLLGNRSMVLESEATIEEALRLYQTYGADFSDCLIDVMNISRGCDTTLTFDKGLSRLPAITAL